jgi:hypothetical protein
MNPPKLFSLAAWLLCATTAHAQLAVTVSPPRVTGSKAVVKLEMKNGFAEKIESARAVCFLADDQGKVVGHATQWVIGGTKERPPLEPGATNSFHLVIPLADNRSRQSAQFASTNLSARVSFSRVVLEGGKLADVTKQVTVTPAAK